MGVQLNQSYEKGSIVCIYIVAVLYAVLCILLSVRLLHKLRSLGENKSSRCTNLSVWVLLGFVVESGLRSISLFYVGAIGHGDDDVLIPPSILYYALMCLLILVWHNFLSKRSGLKAKAKARVVMMIWLAVETVALLTLIIWRMIVEATHHGSNASMFEHHNSVIFFMDGHLSLLAAAALFAIAWQLRKERMRMVELAEVAATTKLLRGGLILAVFCVFRGVVIVGSGLIPGLQGNLGQSYIIPIFYAVQWLALMLSVSILSGPQRAPDEVKEKQSMISSKYRLDMDVAFINAQARNTTINSLGSPGTSPRGSPVVGYGSGNADRL